MTKLNENLEIGNTSKKLKDLANSDTCFVENGLRYSKIGKYDNSHDLYVVEGDIGYLPNATTTIYTWTNNSKFSGWIQINFIAYSGNTKISLPYIYPSTQYINYWVTLDEITDSSVQVITGANRSNFKLWLSGICVLAK